MWGKCQCGRGGSNPHPLVLLLIPFRPSAPEYAILYAAQRGTSSFIRFFALFFGVFQYFHMHIRGRYFPPCTCHIYSYFQQLLDFSVSCHLIRISEPYMRFLSVRSKVCLQLLSDSVTRRTPLRFGYVLRCCLRALGTFTR